MIPCPSVNCRTEVIDKSLYINAIRINANDIPFKVKTKITKCYAKDQEPVYKYKCEENAIDVKIKNLLDSEQIIIDESPVTVINKLDFPNFIGQL